jgi:hypothetical protein
MTMLLNRRLFEDVEMCARAVGQEPDRFLADVIESYIAARRLARSIPTTEQLAKLRRERGGVVVMQ